MGKLAKDQIEDYTLRKKQWIEITEKWLSGYNPKT
jgi:5-methyltetrahydrofolate--homocysteine methyltransferase